MIWPASGFSEASLGLLGSVPKTLETVMFELPDKSRRAAALLGLCREVPGAENHSNHGMMAGTGGSSWPVETQTIERGPGVTNIAMMPTSRLDEPGIGLDNVGHRVLRYSQLRSLAPNPDHRMPGREMEIHLTSNMERYMWSFNGVEFADITAPIIFHEGERVRVTLINNTMMPHPIHLHGMFFDLVNGAGHNKPRKHTVIVKPGEKLSFDVTADHVGDWAFHCHLFFHMHAGMIRNEPLR